MRRSPGRCEMVVVGLCLWSTVHAAAALALLLVGTQPRMVLSLVFVRCAGALLSIGGLVRLSSPSVLARLLVDSRTGVSAGMCSRALCALLCEGGTPRWRGASVARRIPGATTIASLSWVLGLRG